MLLPYYELLPEKNKAGVTSLGARNYSERGHQAALLASLSPSLLENNLVDGDCMAAPRKRATLMR